MGIGSAVVVLGMAGGITMTFIGGPGYVLFPYFVVPGALAGGVVAAGAHFRARHDAWFGSRDRTRKARAARIVGWPLVALGTAFAFGGGVATYVLLHRTEPGAEVVDDFGVPLRYPGATATAAVATSLGPGLLTAGSSTLAWGHTYPRWRKRKLEFTAGGFRLRF